MCGAARKKEPGSTRIAQLGRQASAKLASVQVSLIRIDRAEPSVSAKAFPAVSGSAVQVAATRTPIIQFGVFDNDRCAHVHGELQKLGISVSQSTVAKYMCRHPRPPSQTWRTFLTNPREPDHGRRFVRRADSHVPVALRARHPRARPSGSLQFAATPASVPVGTKDVLDEATQKPMAVSVIVWCASPCA